MSNSQETNESEYNREFEILRNQDQGKRLVYFSTLAIFYSDSRYTRHKREMEERIERWFPRRTIVRLGNIAWGDNPHTLINFLKNKIKKGEPYEVRDEYRYVIEEEEFLHWMRLIPDWNCEMNLTGKMMKVKEIVQKYCMSEEDLGLEYCAEGDEIREYA